MKPGPYDLNTIICGDNVEIMRQLPDECIDLTVTSPPYDLVDYDEAGNLITHPDKGLRDYEGYSWDFAAVAGQLWRVTKPGGIVVWVVGDATVNGSETGSSFRQALYFMGLGFNVETMIYNREALGAKGSHNFYWQGFEYMFILVKGIPKVFNPIRDKTNKFAGCSTKGERLNQNGSKRQAQLRIIPEYSQRGNVWTMGGGDREFIDHPAAFPVELAADHIISWSNPGDLVLDPFIGSGTTAKMAAILGRNYLGIDTSENYCNLARRRVANAERELRGEWKPIEDNGNLAGLPMFEGIE